jgi:hypothetical protein
MTSSGLRDTQINAAWELGAIARAAEDIGEQAQPNPYRPGTALRSEWAAGWAQEDREIRAGR